jgi:hypothetical protein
MNNTSTSSATGRVNLPIDQKAMGGALGAIQKRISSTKANANNSNSNIVSEPFWALTPASGRGQTLDCYQRHCQEVPTSKAGQCRQT